MSVRKVIPVNSSVYKINTTDGTLFAVEFTGMPVVYVNAQELERLLDENNSKLFAQYSGYLPDYKNHGTHYFIVHVTYHDRLVRDNRQQVPSSK